MDDTYSLDTPEGLRLDYEIAGLGSRFLGALIDTSVLLVALLALFYTAMFFVSLSSAFGLGASSREGSFPDTALIGWIAALVTLLVFALIWGYYVFFEMMWSGQSPGKRLTGLRVVGQDGYPVTFAASLIRNLVRLIDFLPVYYAIGMLSMFLDPKSRRLGDFVAGTIVIKERSSMSADDLLTDFDESLDPSISIPNVERLSVQERRLIDDLLTRFRALTPDCRRELALSIASHIAARLEYDRGGISPARFLRLVQQTYRPGVQSPRAAIANIQNLTDADYTMIREYFLRSQTLAPDRSEELADRIASVIARKLDIGDAEIADPTAFLRQVGESYRDARKTGTGANPP